MLVSIIREISAELAARGHFNGQPFSAASINSMLR
jgi:hypothetical protein